MWRVIRGATRLVILTRRWAIKLPRLRSPHGTLWALAHGVLANLSERDLSDHPQVCPVRWSAAGLVNVYPRAEPAHGVDLSALATPDLIGDARPDHLDNVGLLGGRLVWLDYDQHVGECVACSRWRGQQRADRTG